MQQQKKLKSAENWEKKSFKKDGFHSIGATICTRRQSRCLPYADFLKLNINMQSAQEVAE